MLVPLLLCVLPALAALVAALSKFPALYFGWRVQRDFERVCAGVGLSSTGSYLSSWKGIAKYGLFDLTGKGRVNGVVLHPKFSNLAGNFEQWTADITPLYGQTVDDFTKQADAFALAHNVPFVAFERGKSGGLVVRAGRVPVARNITYQPFYMPIEGNHLLIIGRTGAGKGSWVWSLVFGLKNAREAGLVRLWGLDPKRVELSYGRDWWDEYADSLEGMLELLEKAEADMHERDKAIQGKARKFTPSPETPLNVIVIDEFAYLSAAVDKKAHDRAQRVIRSILWLGRATGYSLVACSQDPRKEVFAERDYFPTKVGLAMEAEMVDLVFGKGAHDAGAYCEQIPPREAGAGSAYVKDEMSSKPVLVRAAWCSDEAIQSMLRPQAQPLVQVYEQGYVQQLGFDGKPLK